MASLKARPVSPKCKCCPYGFHIDLDFVKFAENVANGNALKQNVERRSFRKASKRQANNAAASPTGNRSLMSPLESIFSDSLENIVSDFEETLNPRDYASDRETFVKGMESRHRSAGYMSDYGPHINRTTYQTPQAQSSSYYRDNYDDEDSKMNSPLRNGYQNPPYSSRKPPTAPVPSSPSQAYCTALGRTISEIKARQDREADERQREARRNILAPYRKREEFSRPKDLGVRSAFVPERSQYEQGKASYLGSKTPEVSRPNYVVSSYQSDAEGTSSWRRGVPVQRSSSAAEMDGFVGERRKKLEELSSMELTKHLPNYTDWRRTPSLQASSYNSLPPKRDADLFRLRLNGTSVSAAVPPTPPARSQFSNAAQRSLLSEGSYSTLPKRESPSTDRYKNLTSVGTSTPPMPPSKPCSECPVLREQIADLSKRLVAVERIRSMSLDESELESRRRVLRNVGTEPESKRVVDKMVGDSCPQKFHVATATSPIHRADFAGDAIAVECANKTTNASYIDRLLYGQLKDCSISPRSTPRCISFGIVTDHIPGLGSLSCSDLPTVVARNKGNHFPNGSDLLQSTKQFADAECCTSHPSVRDCACDALPVVLLKDEAISTDFQAPVLISRSVGSSYSLTLKDIGIMTTPQSSPLKLAQITQTEEADTRSVAVETSAARCEDRGVDSVKAMTADSSTSCEFEVKPTTSDMAVQSANVPIMDAVVKCCTETIGTQTDFDLEQTEPRVLSDSEIAESLWLMPSKDSVDIAVGNDDDYAVEYDHVAENNNIYYSDEVSKKKSESNDDEEDVVGVISITEETVSDLEAAEINESVEESIFERQETDDDKPRALGQERAAIVRKLLTETKIPQPQTSFVRGTATSRSCRVESKKGDSLEYITDQYKTQNGSTPSTPQTREGALKEKVVLKKEPTAVLSKVPDPIPARIPRPKIAKYSPVEAQAQSPDEEAEVADRLTPLRSEMRTLRTFNSGRMAPVARIPPPAIPVQAQHDAAYDNPAIEDDTTSSDSEGSYDTNEIKNSSTPPPFEMTKQLKEALDVLKHKFDSLPVDPAALDWATKYVQHEWLKTAARRTALTQQVQGFIDALEHCSTKVLSLVINMTDQNENTALHYAVSHGNFDVVSAILDSRVCNLDKANKAGYTAVMLAALCEIGDEIESAVVRRLFQMGNVNAKAAQHGQTALMLAVSHGKMDTTRLLLECDADLNMQDEEGSTALMCAAEHGHKEIVKLLLAQPGIDASISDCDSSTALSIAVENRHRDIGVLIYAHLNYARNEQSHHDSNTSTSVH